MAVNFPSQCEEVLSLAQSLLARLSRVPDILDILSLSSQTGELLLSHTSTEVSLAGILSRDYSSNT